MSSRFAVFGGRISHLGVSELYKDRTKADIVCDVLFLDCSTQYFNVSKHDDGHVLLDMVFHHMGLMEREYFGLQFSEEPLDSPRWLDPSKPIKKQFKGGCPWRLKFRVRFFISDPNSLQQQQTRHLYFLQVKSDIQSGRLTCPLSSAVVLASYAVQAELGDHSPEHTSGYLSSYCFLPHQDEDFLSRVENLHLQHSGLSQSEAELYYLNTARTLDFYGVELHSARDSSNADLLVGIASGGLAVFRNTACTSFFSWVSIVKISFKRKRFYIQLRQKHRESRDCTVAFNMFSYRACKNLWRSCVEHHAFFQTDSMSQDRKLMVIQQPDYVESDAWHYMEPSASKIPLFGAPGDQESPIYVSTLYTQLVSFSNRGLTSTSMKSPRLRHNIHKAHHSSMDNLTSEMTYLTDSEDVFYTYRSSMVTKGGDDEAATDLCSSDKKISEVIEGSEVVQQHRTDGSESVDQESEMMTQPLSNALGTGDSHLPDKGIFPEEKPGGLNSQYYFDKTEELEGELHLVRLAPDKDGKFGFNVKGGVDQKMPLVISHVTLDSPASKCVPSLQEGDHIVLINGRDISEHTHDQVVMFIKASRESHTKELALLVRRKAHSSCTKPLPMCNMGFPLLGDAVLPQGHQYGKNLEDSMVHLKEGLNTGSLLIQFEQLYRKKPGLSTIDAKSAQNIEKNRYKDVLPYDITRVILQNEENNYINASHIKVELPAAGVMNHYVASQGALPHTCCDFWQAVWEQKSDIIIMLTTLTERGRSKCHQYWPDPPEVRQYGGLQVCCHSEEANLAYVFREFTLTETQTGVERAICHLQYVAWPDHGVPDDPTDFLDFVKFVQQKQGSSGPLVVHCSAGIGRTGVFIIMDTAMQLIGKDQPVYPLDLVRKLRDQRAMMVQTVSQFRFVCEAILRVYEERKTVFVPSTHS